MKKSYSKPLVKEIPPDFGRLEKGSDGEYRLIHTQHSVIGFVDTPTTMTPEEIKIHLQAFINKIPIHGGDKLQQLYDSDLKYSQVWNRGLTESLYVKNLKHDLTEISQDRSNRHNQIRAEVFLQFLEEQEKRIFKSIINSNRPAEKVKFEINGRNIPSLVKRLQQRHYFDEKYYDSVLNWFNGVPPKSPIPLNVNANIFSSLIADLKDQKFINKKTTKKFCSYYIADSFLFNGTHNDESYIYKVMRPNGVGRVDYKSLKIPDIKLF